MHNECECAVLYSWRCLGGAQKLKLGGVFIAIAIYDDGAEFHLKWRRPGEAGCAIRLKVPNEDTLIFN